MVSDNPNLKIPSRKKKQARPVTFTISKKEQLNFLEIAYEKAEELIAKKNAELKKLKKENKKLRADKKNLIDTLALARWVIGGLEDQQAMTDDWYKPHQLKIVSVLCEFSKELHQAFAKTGKAPW